MDFFHRQTILLIEDDHDNRVALRLALEEANYNVLTAANGKVGLGLLDRGAKPDLILLDMMMPIMGGEEFLKRLKDRPDSNNIPVVILTSFKDKLELVANTPAILKPLDLELLTEKIKAYLTSPVAE